MKPLTKTKLIMNRFTPVIPLAILLACLPSCDDGVKSNYSPQ
ncbi:MAG: hypothetical protein ACI8UO_005481, partial [Verrucomicrobiales bacterium]